MYMSRGKTSPAPADVSIETAQPEPAGDESNHKVVCSTTCLQMAGGLLVTTSPVWDELEEDHDLTSVDSPLNEDHEPVLL